MGIWKINIERKHCVIAYAMPTHSVHSPIFFQGIPEPPSEVAWIARYFFCLAANDKKETIMGKVQILAILSMDGCLSELNPKKRLFRSPEDYGMEEIRGKALYRLTPDYTISILQDQREKEDDTYYLLEADAKTVGYANGLIRMNAVDEIIIYIMPCIIGTGDHFFKSGLFPTDWTLAENRKYGGGIIRLTYRRNRKRR